MKTTTASLLAMIIVMVLSCQKDLPDPAKETGSLCVEIGLNIQVSKVKSAIKSAAQTDDFSVRIFREDGSEAMYFPTVSSMPDTIELEIGNYYVEASSDNDLPAAFENPHYLGVSEVFSISSGMQETVTVTCQLANTIVSVGYSDQVRNLFNDYRTVVSTDLDSLVYLKDELRWGYFRPSPLNIRVELSYLQPDGSDTTKMLEGNIPDPLPRRHYEVLVDASIDGGLASFQVLLDSSEVVREVVEISGTSGSTATGIIGSGDLLITEIMFNPDALSDTEGEWFEIYNRSDQTINLQHLIIGRDDVNRHTITDSIDLPPGAYHVLARSVTATGAVNAYVYGSDITLTNTGAVLSIYNAGTEAVPGDLIFSVDYGAVNFPGPSGASICLDPALLNPSDALLGSSWCTSSSVYSTGDLGTPASINDSCQ